MSSVPSYISGYVDQALIVNSVQYVTVSSYLSFFSRSFTIEAWIYVTSLISSVDYGIFGQYQAATTRQWLFCIIRSNKMFFGFFNDDVGGSTTLSTNIWTHVP
ncbi:unnamed protein product [Rotaria sordida]|uniref:Uncharacterized protein n=1 Tax=Rotaria sordida TaxID=392033 RepID=A0A815RFB0_9BILA|nr:unnamed protein product [Rotaria sordida]CAF1646627.1 unnamed protein product [Rotaria sordida]